MFLSYKGNNIINGTSISGLSVLLLVQKYSTQSITPGELPGRAPVSSHKLISVSPFLFVCFCYQICWCTNENWFHQVIVYFICKIKYEKHISFYHYSMFSLGATKIKVGIFKYDLITQYILLFKRWSWLYLFMYNLFIIFRLYLSP